MLGQRDNGTNVPSRRDLGGAKGVQLIVKKLTGTTGQDRDKWDKCPFGKAEWAGQDRTIYLYIVRLSRPDAEIDIGERDEQRGRG